MSNIRDLLLQVEAGVCKLGRSRAGIVRKFAIKPIRGLLGLALLQLEIRKIRAGREIGLLHGQSYNSDNYSSPAHTGGLGPEPDLRCHFKKCFVIERGNF